MDPLSLSHAGEGLAEHEGIWGEGEGEAEQKVSGWSKSVAQTMTGPQLSSGQYGFFEGLGDVEGEGEREADLVTVADGEYGCLEGVWLFEALQEGATLLDALLVLVAVLLGVQLFAGFLEGVRDLDGRGLQEGRGGGDGGTNPQPQE